LDYLYGKEQGVVSEAKSNYVLPWNVMGQADIARVINSDEVQSVLKVKGPRVTKRQRVLKKNPLRNKYNPYSLCTNYQASAFAIESLCQGIQSSRENSRQEREVGYQGGISHHSCSRLELLGSSMIGAYILASIIENCRLF
jgi:hypothetical protein